MNIVVGSAFRNSAHDLVRYLNRILALQAQLGEAHHVRVVAVEGDSTDHTARQLPLLAAIFAVPLEVITCAHGLGVFGSTESPIRMAALSKVGNAIFDAVRETDDLLVYVESDLLWDPRTIADLIDLAHRREGGFDVFAPMVYAGPHFYDTWAFRTNGQRFGPFAPYHADLTDGLTRLDSAGSCLVMRAAVARACRIRDDGALVGWCADARAQGYTLAVHPQLGIHHP